MKTTLFSLLTIILLLTTGCTPAAPSPTPIPTPAIEVAPTPTEATLILATSQATAQPAKINPLKISFIDPVRVIPAGMDPATMASEIYSQYQIQTMNSSSAWAGGTTGNSHAFTLGIETLQKNAQNEITLKYPFHLSITSNDASADSANIIAPMGGGGGGETRVFPPLLLKQGEFDLTPDNPDPVSLIPSTHPSMYHDFRMICENPGIYDLSFDIPYTIPGAATEDTLTMNYKITLACPQNIVLWMALGPEAGALREGGRLTFQNGNYIQQP